MYADIKITCQQLFKKKKKERKARRSGHYPRIVATVAELIPILYSGNLSGCQSRCSCSETTIRHRISLSEEVKIIMRKSVENFIKEIERPTCIYLYAIMYAQIDTEILRVFECKNVL